MNTRNTLLGSAMGFAHLAGLGALGKKSKAKGRADDQDDEDTKSGAEDEEDEDKAKKGKKAKGRSEDPDDEDDKTGAEGDDDDSMAEDDKGDDPEASAEEDDKEEDDDPPPRSKGKKSTAEFRRGVAAERKRCAAIFGAKAAARNIPLAASLAFDTGMSAQAAINVLKGQPAPSQAGADRSRQNPDLGADPGRTGASGGIKKSWGAAIDRVAPGATKSGGWGGAVERAQR